MEGKNRFTGLGFFGLGQRKMKREQDENQCVLGFICFFWVCYKVLSATRELINLIRLKLFHASPKPVCGV